VTQQVTIRGALFTDITRGLELLAAGDAAGRTLIERWAGDTRRQRTLATALAARWSARWDTITALLTAWSENDRPEHWAAAAHGWGMAGRDSPETALVMLERLLRAHPRAARAVAAALPAIWANHERFMLRVLTRWQADPNPDLRRVATGALASYQGPVGPAAAFLRTSAADVDPGVRRRAVAALTHLLILDPEETSGALREWDLTARPTHAVVRASLRRLRASGHDSEAAKHFEVLDNP